MVKKMITDKLSIHVPQRKMEERPVERLMKLGAKKDRSINYLVVEATLEYLNRERRRANGRRGPLPGRKPRKRPYSRSASRCCLFPSQSAHSPWAVLEAASPTRRASSPGH